MKKIDEMKAKYIKNDNAHPEGIVLYGYVYGVNIKAITHAAICVVNNVWWPVKGLAMWFSQKNYLIDFNKEGIIFNRVKHLSRKFRPDKNLAFSWSDVTNISVRRISFDNYYIMKLYFMQGSDIDFEFKLKRQKEDYQKLCQFIKETKNIDIASEPSFFQTNLIKR